MISTDDINSRFGFHKATPEAVANMRAVRNQVRELAMLIQALCPEGSEKAAAFDNLQVVMMKANSAIVQQCPVDPADFE